MPVSDLDIARSAHVFIQHGILFAAVSAPPIVLATLLVPLLRNVSVPPATNSANGTRSGGMAR
jgi:hypothetical protein